MARSRYEFIKVEMRLFNDPRFFMLDEWDQLTYIKLIAMAKQTKNKVKKDWTAIKRYLRTDRSPTEVEASVNRVLTEFDNIHQDRFNLWFSGWDEKYNYGGVEEDKEEDKDKEEDGEVLLSKKKPTFNGMQMRKKNNAWWCIPKSGGEWLKFVGKESEITWV
jgi:hypothetical protein